MARCVPPTPPWEIESANATIRTSVHVKVTLNGHDVPNGWRIQPAVIRLAVPSHQPPTQPPPLMTFREAAARLGVTENRLRVRVRSGTWPCHRDARLIRFTEGDLEQVLRLMSEERRVDGVHLD